MSEQKTSGHWATEAFDFLRLFQRFGGHVAGLLMLEIGWALVLWLVAQLSGNSPTPVITIPWLSTNFQIVARDFRLTTAFTGGALVIAMIWSLTSGLYLYLLSPIYKLYGLLLLLATHLIFIALAVFLGLPAFIVSIPYELLLIRRWEKKQDPENLKQAIDKNGQKAVIDLARSRIGFKSTWLLDWMGEKYIRVLTHLASAGRIGLAPLYSYSFDEDQYAAKAPLQIFASAIGTLRLRLRSLDAIRHIQFQTLPGLVSVSTDERARWVRKWLGLDTLLWGSYLSTKPPKIWLNIDQALNEKLPDSEAPQRREETDPFGPFFELEQSLIVIEQHDPLDAYIVLLISLLLTLQSRRTRKFTLYQKGADKLYYSYGDEQAILASLVRDALFTISDPIPSDQHYPHAKRVLVNLASKWVANQLSGGIADEFARNHELLKDVMKKCIQLNPSDANNYYRLAVLECLLEKEQETWSALKAGQERDKKSHWVESVYLDSMAIVAIATLGGTVLGEKLKLAEIVVYTARALALGGEDSKQVIRAEYQKTLAYQLREEGIDTDPLSTVEKILHKLLDIDVKPRQPRKALHTQNP